VDETIVISKDNDRRPIRKLLEPPTKPINELGSDALRLGVDNIATDDDHIRAEIFQLLEEVLEYLGVLIMTLQTTPVDVCDMCDLDQRMLPLLMILERLIIP
jgi:hypothetical protein